MFTRDLAIKFNHKDPFSDMDCSMTFENWNGVPRDIRVHVSTVSEPDNLGSILATLTKMQG
jgi:hypothetical protein